MDQIRLCIVLTRLDRTRRPHVGLDRSLARASPEVADLAKRLLDAPADWMPKGTSEDGWVELLHHCGVQDGLVPIASGNPRVAPPAQGWWWADTERIADHHKLGEPDRSAWLDAVAVSDWPHHPGAEYRVEGGLTRIPGQGEYER